MQYPSIPKKILMTSIERISKALNFQEADRVPFDLCGTTVSAFSKDSYIAAMQHKELPADYMEKLIDPIQQIIIPGKEIMDFLNIDTYRVGARRIMDFENRLQEKEGAYHIVDHYQCEWAMKKQGDLYFNQMNYPLYDYETLAEALDHFNIYDVQDFKKQMVLDIDAQLEGSGKRAIVLDRNCAGLTEMSLRIRGYDKWFMDTILDPEGTERLLDLFLEHKMAYWDLLISIIKERGVEEKVMVVSEADDLGTQTSLLLSPDILRSMVIPKIARLLKFIEQQLPKAKMMFHTDGAIMELIPDLIEAGVDILNPVQYTAAGMDLAELKRRFGRDIVFWGGGIDTQNILNKGTVQQVRDEVKKNIEILAPGGGFVFATVHNIQADVSPQNFWAMWETLMEYGRY
jgi:uroporphyrinogen decarboxylase